MPHASPRRAFTLIELLIVVAIIAILAAIAVPNFLEAQTRSKISRVKSDMRSFSVAMEAYHVDNGRYAVPSDDRGAYIPSPVMALTVNPMETRLPILLTTPVAYITSLSHDPFAEKVRHGESQIYHCITWDYVQIRRNNSPTSNWNTVWRVFFLEVTGQEPPSNVAYFFVSFGPDKKHDMNVPHITAPTGPHVHGSGQIYDPTNGTISDGDIFYFGPGRGFAI